MLIKNLQSKAAQLLALVMVFLSNAYLFAQDVTAPSSTTMDVESTKTTTTEEWYTNPLYLIIGGVVLLLLLAMLMRGRKRD